MPKIRIMDAGRMTRKELLEAVKGCPTHKDRIAIVGPGGSLREAQDRLEQEGKKVTGMLSMPEKGIHVIEYSTDPEAETWMESVFPNRKGRAFSPLKVVNMECQNVS